MNLTKGAKNLTVYVRTNAMVDTFFDSLRFPGRTANGLRIESGERKGEVRVEARCAVIRDCFEAQQADDGDDGVEVFEFDFLRRKQKRRRLCGSGCDIRSSRPVALSF